MLSALIIIIGKFIHMLCKDLLNVIDNRTNINCRYSVSISSTEPNLLDEIVITAQRYGTLVCRISALISRYMLSCTMSNVSLSIPTNIFSLISKVSISTSSIFLCKWGEVNHIAWCVTQVTHGFIFMLHKLIFSFQLRNGNCQSLIRSINLISFKY